MVSIFPGKFGDVREICKLNMQKDNVKKKNWLELIYSYLFLSLVDEMFE